MSADLSQRIALTRAQAAESVGVSRDTIRRAVQSGDLIEHYITATPVILVDDLRAWITAAPTEGTKR